MPAFFSSNPSPDEPAALRGLRIASLVEGLTLLALVAVAVPLKHLAGWPHGVTWMGPLHGLAFLAYAWMAVEAVSAGGWRRAEALRLFGSALVPGGAFFNIGWLRRKATETGAARGAAA